MSDGSKNTEMDPPACLEGAERTKCWAHEEDQADDENNRTKIRCLDRNGRRNALNIHAVLCSHFSQCISRIPVM
ncbi:hypothetical protein AOLI_G00162730 [Acnodon oligacanthus]